jgi:hypothetical protein
MSKATGAGAAEEKGGALLQEGRKSEPKRFGIGSSNSGARMSATSASSVVKVDKQLWT